MSVCKEVNDALGVGAEQTPQHLLNVANLQNSTFCGANYSSATDPPFAFRLFVRPSHGCIYRTERVCSTHNILREVNILLRNYRISNLHGRHIFILTMTCVNF